MTWHDIARRWEELKHWFAEDWQYFSDEEIDALSGERDELITAISEKYDLTPDAAEREAEHWVERIRAKSDG